MGGKLSRSYQEQLTGKKVTYNSHGAGWTWGKEKVTGMLPRGKDGVKA